MFVHCLRFCGCGVCGVDGWWILKLFINIYMSRLKFYGKFNNTALPKVHTVSFMLHISTPVVKYLAVIIAYLFKW